MQNIVTPELIESLTEEMVSQAEAAGAKQSLEDFVTSYRKLTNLKRLRADIEEFRLSVYKFINLQKQKQVKYVNANIQVPVINIPVKKYFALSTPEQDMIIYWLKTEVLDKPSISFKDIINAWVKEMVIATNWRHCLLYLINQKYRLKVQADTIAVLSFSFRSAAMADYIVGLRAACRQSRENIIHAFSGRGVIIPGSVNTHLTLRDCISRIYLEQKAMARIAIKHHKKVSEGINKAAMEPLPDHVAAEFPEDKLYPEPEYVRNADQEDEDGELPIEPEDEDNETR